MSGPRTDRERAQPGRCWLPESEPAWRLGLAGLNATARWARVLMATCALLARLLLSNYAIAQDAAISREAPIKAAFLYNFAKYTTLSEDYARTIDKSDQIVTIGIVGDSAVEPYLRKIAANKTVKGKPLLVLRFDAIETIIPCHILFIPQSVTNAQRWEVAKVLQGTNAFVVSERQGEPFQQTSFYLEDNHVRFEINLSAIEAAKIQVDSRLLALGRVVSAQEQP